MQADVPGVHTLYDAVHLANNADGSAGGTAVVGSMQVARHADGDQRHDDAQRAGERIGPAAAWCRRASDGVDTATATVTFNIAAAPVSPSGGGKPRRWLRGVRQLRLFSGLLVAAGRRRVAAAARRSVRIAVAGPAGPLGGSPQGRWPPWRASSCRRRPPATVVAPPLGLAGSASAPARPLLAGSPCPGQLPAPVAGGFFPYIIKTSLRNAWTCQRAALIYIDLY